MNKAIIRLKEIFSENRVTSFSDFQKLPPDGFKRLDASVYGWFSSFRQDAVRQLAETDSLNMCLGLKRNTEEFAVGAPMEMIVKKLSFFSQTGVILTPKFSSPGKSSRAVPDSWYYLVLNYLPLIETGALMVLPKAVACLVSATVGGIHGDGFVMGGRAGNVNRDWFLLEEEIPSIRIIDLSEKDLRQQLVEAHAHYGMTGDQRVYIYMPHLANISAELLSSLRQHHGDVFARYNRIIQSFFNGSAKVKSEKQLLEVMKATDEGIRQIEAELKRISKSQVVQNTGVAVIASAEVLCQCIDNESVKGVVKFFAAGSVIPSALNYFALKALKNAVIEKTPFYFPWLIHHEALKLAPK
jgi:hypothetical protein